MRSFNDHLQDLLGGVDQVDISEDLVSKEAKVWILIKAKRIEELEDKIESMVTNSVFYARMVAKLSNHYHDIEKGAKALKLLEDLSKALKGDI